MTLRELANALDNYPGDAQIQCGLAIPNLYINSTANLSISGNGPTPQESTLIRIIAVAPPIAPQPTDALPTQGPISES